MPTPQDTIRAASNNLPGTPVLRGQVADMVIGALQRSQVARDSVENLAELHRQETTIMNGYEVGGYSRLIPRRNHEGRITEFSFRNQAGDWSQMSENDINRMNRIERDRAIAESALQAQLLNQVPAMTVEDAGTRASLAQTAVSSMIRNGQVTPQFLRDIAANRTGAANIPPNPLLDTGIQLIAASPTGDTSLFDGTNPNTGGPRRGAQQITNPGIRPT